MSNMTSCLPVCASGETACKTLFFQALCNPLCQLYLHSHNKPSPSARTVTVSNTGSAIRSLQPAAAMCIDLINNSSNLAIAVLLVCDPYLMQSCRQAVAAVKAKAPIGQGRANAALGVVLGQLAAMPGLPQKDRADYHDEAVLALQQAVACDPADVNILYNLALIQVRPKAPRCVCV